MANVGDAFNTFFWITFVFFIAKYNMAESDGTADTKWAAGYLILMIIMMYYINSNIMKEKCGFSENGVIFSATLLPWILIFGVLSAVLIAAPGWKAPFSNTVGYLFVKMSGGEKCLIDLLNKKKLGDCADAAESDSAPTGGGADAAATDVTAQDLPPSAPQKQQPAQGGGGKTYRRRSPMIGGKGGDDDVSFSKVLKESSDKTDETICLVYHDPGPLINQFTIADFPVAILKLKSMLKDEYVDMLERGGFPGPGEIKGEVWKPILKFRKLIFLKDLVAEWIWYLLGGSIVLATSDNIIMNNSCAKSVDQHTDYHNDVMDDADNPDADDGDDQEFTLSY